MNLTDLIKWLTEYFFGDVFRFCALILFMWSLSGVLKKAAYFVGGLIGDFVQNVKRRYRDIITKEQAAENVQRDIPVPLKKLINSKQPKEETEKHD